VSLLHRRRRRLKVTYGSRGKISYPNSNQRLFFDGSFPIELLLAKTRAISFKTFNHRTHC
jgi:hypothetical protein